MFKRIFLIFFITISFNYAQGIKERIDEILNKIPESTEYSVTIYDPIKGETVYSKNPNLPLIPASNTKLYTTAAALVLLGGNYEIKTVVYCDDKNISDHVINGNIYIKGFGNPTLSDYDLIKLAQELKLKGITSITGNIYGDDSYFDEIYSRSDWIIDEITQYPLPPVSALVLDRNSHSVVVKKGRRQVVEYKTLSDPPSMIAEIFKGILSEEGINVEGSGLKGITPKEIYDLAEKNIKVKDLLCLINKPSDNFYAECLFKTIGAAYSNDQGNAFYSTQAVKTFLEENDVFSEGTNLVDGSGLSRYDHTTTTSIVSLLEKVYFDLGNFDDFFNSLSVYGVDGTLRNRPHNYSGPRINFHGKTGTINGVTSLSGYLTTKTNRDLIVSIIINFKSSGHAFYKGLEDEIVVAANDL